MTSSVWQSPNTINSMCTTEYIRCIAFYNMAAVLAYYNGLSSFNDVHSKVDLYSGSI